MIKLLKQISLAAAFAFAVFGSSQAFAATAVGNASASILSPLTVAQVTPINFATVIIPTGAPAGTAVVDIADAITFTGGLTGSGAVSSADFNITGTPSAAVNIAFTPGSLTGGGDAMPVNGFTTNAITALNASGLGALIVGATLNVNAGQNGGAYAGTYGVTVNYQ